MSLSNAQPTPGAVSSLTPKASVGEDLQVDPDHPKSLIGASLGNYRILELLGEGGMGAVYLAENPLIESKVAIKVLHASWVTNSDMVRRFIDEARAVNRVGHPGTVRIHDFSEQEDGGLYLVMEYLEGQTLREEMRLRGAMDPQTAVEIVAQAGAVLDAVHKKGIVHRDLKPENIFRVKDDAIPSGLRVKVLDFGIAKLTEDAGKFGPKTETGLVFGTPHYMSNEQCCDTKNVDLRTDIYSLGAITYELLCNRTPYRADSLGALVKMQVEGAPLEPSAVNDLVSPLMSAVVLKALALNPDQRYQSVLDFCAALEASVDAPASRGAPEAKARPDPSTAPPERGITPDTFQGMGRTQRPSQEVNQDGAAPAAVGAITPDATRAAPAYRIWGLVILALTGASALTVWALSGSPATEHPEPPVARTSPPPTLVTKSTPPSLPAADAPNPVTEDRKQAVDARAGRRPSRGTRGATKTVTRARPHRKARRAKKAKVTPSPKRARPPKAGVVKKPADEEEDLLIKSLPPVAPAAGKPGQEGDTP